jgi:alpha-beta hydrolase superfamily lysophospholipase
MGEHSGRYLGLIEVLTSNGFVVYGGFHLLVQDMVRLTSIAKEENPELPFIVLGHSMGSFAARQYQLDHSREIDGSPSPVQALSMDSREPRPLRRQEGTF